ncbi:hypothetical protein J3Q64DRAFT_1278307 [Phycomyces blakesleeanus]|uniref:Uncharacterized protein n=1 Tax=Phycomyces blakesleeanus TaxID=4837 RepID=A0ABR3AR00_PHYBL
MVHKLKRERERESACVRVRVCLCGVFYFIYVDTHINSLNPTHSCSHSLIHLITIYIYITRPFPIN